MSATDEQTEIDGETMDAVRAQVTAVMTARSIAMTKVAAEADVAYGTFSAWMTGKYAGNNSRVAVSVQKWLAAEGEKNRIRSAMPRGPGFVQTPTSSAIIDTLEFAHQTPDFVLIGAGAGVGKTTAAKRYMQTHQSVFLLTCEPWFSKPRMVLNCIAQTLDLTEKYSAQTLSWAIQRRLRGCGALLIIDEAQHLSSAGLDQVRTLHDLADVGVALLGNETVYSRIEGHARQPQFAQLYRRVGMRLSVKQPKGSDISLLLDAWKIEGATERRVLTDIAKKPGGLGSMTKTLRMASYLNNGETPTVELIRRAWESISGTKLMAEA